MGVRGRSTQTSRSKHQTLSRCASYLSDVIARFESASAGNATNCVTDGWGRLQNTTTTSEPSPWLPQGRARVNLPIVCILPIADGLPLSRRYGRVRFRHTHLQFGSLVPARLLPWPPALLIKAYSVFWRADEIARPRRSDWRMGTRGALIAISGIAYRSGSEG